MTNVLGAMAESPTAIQRHHFGTSAALVFTISLVSLVLCLMFFDIFWCFLLNSCLLILWWLWLTLSVLYIYRKKNMLWFEVYHPVVTALKSCEWSVSSSCHSEIRRHPLVATWWLIPLSKWLITPVINGICVGLIHWNHWGYIPLTKWVVRHQVPFKEILFRRLDPQLASVVWD